MSLICLLGIACSPAPEDESKIDNKGVTAQGVSDLKEKPKSKLSNPQMSLEKALIDIVKPRELIAELRLWKDIQSKKQIRAGGLFVDVEADSLYQPDMILEHRSMLEDFASTHGLQLEWTNFNNLDDLMQALKVGTIDIISRNLTITPQRRTRMQFTMPVKVDYEYVVMAKGEKFEIELPLTLSLPKGSAYVETIEQHYSHWDISLFDQGYSADDIVDGLNQGDIKASVLDGEVIKILKDYRNDFEAVHRFKQENKMAWAVRKKSHTFTQQLNEFIQEALLKTDLQKSRMIDFNAVKKQNKPIRMITRNSPETYFMWKGEPRGFDYDMMQKFAASHGLRLEVKVADSIDEMEQMLTNGVGDIIAGAYSISESRAKKFALSRRYAVIEQVLVHHQDYPIKSLETLKGKTIHVKKNSVFWSTAQQLKQDYGAIINEQEATVSTEDLLEFLAQGEQGAVIADSHLFKVMAMQYPELVSMHTIKESEKLAFAVRKNNPQLKSALDKFVRKEFKSVFYNVTKKKYFYNERKQKVLDKYRLERGKPISPYDALVKKHAAQYGLDWRLIVAQMYQESRFKPNARSNAGALGLMQILPKTGKELGMTNLKDPNQSIEAGVRYMQWTSERFKHTTKVEERIYFALAAYNAGFGHIRDAQKLAKKKGWRSDVWFDNVEKALLLLQKREYYKQSRFGYCRGWEPVNYVREIKERYLQYLDLT